MQTVTAVAGCHQFFDPLTMMFACYFPADCEMLLADIVSHVLTLFMEFMYHLMLESASSNHYDVIGPFFSLLPPLH
ncbi:hypothetical protein JHK84_044689 [Glycine max]|nr:hypothetical protein JHK84_044689 [Glycine max]KHN27578.1 hypothetical protein glysoja_018690 [Glycine soja]